MESNGDNGDTRQTESRQDSQPRTAVLVQLSKKNLKEKKMRACAFDILLPQSQTVILTQQRVGLLLRMLFTARVHHAHKPVEVTPHERPSKI